MPATLNTRNKPSHIAPLNFSRKLICFFLVFSLLLFSGCAKRMGYNFLDWIMLWQIEKFVNLKGSQEEQAKIYLDNFHEWHRRTQLEQYAEYLTSLKALINAGSISGKQIHAETDKMQLLLDQSLNQLLPDMASIIAKLSDAQAEELLDNIKEENEEFIEDYVDISDEKKFKKRIKEMKGYLKPWFGSLSDAQENAVKTWANTLVPHEELTAAQQELWRQQFARMLNKRHDENQLLAELKEVMFYRTDNWPEETQKVYDQNQALTYNMLAELVNTLNEKQLKKFNKTIDNYIELCRDLASEATESAALKTDAQPLLEPASII